MAAGYGTYNYSRAAYRKYDQNSYYVYGNVVRQAQAAPLRRPQVQERPAKPKRASRQVLKNRNRAMTISPAYALFLTVAAVCAVLVCVLYLNMQAGVVSRSENVTALQEEVRNNTGKSSAGRIMWPGGPLGEDLPSYWISPKYFEEPHIYGAALPSSSKETAESQTESSFSPDPNMSFIQSRFFSGFPLQSVLHPQSTKKTSEKKSEDEDSSENLSTSLPTGLRYAPAVGSLIGSIASAFAKPDYEHSNSLLEAASRQRPSRVRFRPVGNYMRYNPLNTSYMMNRLNAETAGTRRALENMSGGNAAAARNQLTALNRSSQDALGDAFIRASQYNDSLRRQVEEFNRGTNMFNSQGAMQADSANAQMQNAYDARRLAALEQAMRMREAADAALEQSRALNFTNLFDNLGDIGRENFSFNQTRIPGLRYGYTDKDGNTVWLNSYGGMLTKRTGKRRRR